jgi:hypothetical protein
MVRRSTSERVLAERQFPVRVRVAVPPGGFGRQLDEMHGWLNLHAGRGRFSIQSAPNDLGVDAAYFYFADTAAAHAFVQRFTCGLAVVDRLPPNAGRE